MGRKSTRPKNKNKEFGTVTEVEYDGQKYPITGLEYCELEDSLDAISGVVGITEGDRESASEWTIYRYLIGLGHFVSKPSSEEPQVSKIFTAPADEVSLPELDQFNEPVREPQWTQSRILNEREKLLRKEEALFKKQKESEVKKLRALNESNSPLKFYHPDGTPYDRNDYSSAKLTMFFIICILIFLAFCCGKGC